ncbi:hypothetical protein KEM54_000965 [Ascosphaera aggregata]|nr:hypothetical protein KEM54_000965 [Ascosphaera aggregata]
MQMIRRNMDLTGRHLESPEPVERWPKPLQKTTSRAAPTSNNPYSGKLRAAENTITNRPLSAYAMGKNIFRKIRKAVSKWFRFKRNRLQTSQEKGKQVFREAYPEETIQPMPTYDSDDESVEGQRPAYRDEAEERYAELVGLGTSRAFAQVGQENHEGGFEPRPTLSP